MTKEIKYNARIAEMRQRTESVLTIDPVSRMRLEAARGINAINNSEKSRLPSVTEYNLAVRQDIITGRPIPVKITDDRLIDEPTTNENKVVEGIVHAPVSISSAAVKRAEKEQTKDKKKKVVRKVKSAAPLSKKIKFNPKPNPRLSKLINQKLNKEITNTEYIKLAAGLKYAKDEATELLRRATLNLKAKTNNKKTSKSKK